MKKDIINNTTLNERHRMDYLLSKEVFICKVFLLRQLSEEAEIEYGGNKMTWCEFKDYWRKKSPGGWSFDDANLQNDKPENKTRF